jgi:hypothetical protein
MNSCESHVVSNLKEHTVSTTFVFRNLSGNFKEALNKTMEFTYLSDRPVLQIFLQFLRRA